MDNIKNFEDFLDRMQGLLDSAKKQGHIIVRVEDLENTFPELAESEDEKIRKAIHIYLDWLDGRKDYAPKGKYTIKDMISWLEKQGEPTDINPSEFDLRLNKLLKQFETLPKEELASSLSFYLNVVQNNGTYKHEEKQGEQKSADKVEPKFHEGEWMCENEPNNYARFIQILEIVNVQGKERYRISRDIRNNEDIVEFNFIEKYFHKFDIKDAKYGDVLVHNDCAFIFVGLEGNIVRALAKTLFDGIIPIYLGEIDENNDYHPATKEQRDFLFKSMKDDGYEWDTEKKELKKIHVIDEGKDEMDYCFTKMMNGERVSPAWSEEDEEIIECLNNCLDELEKENGWRFVYVNNKNVELNKIRNWLNSLKPQNNITDEELAQAKKDAYNDALDKIEYHSGEPTFDDGWSAAIDYIRKKSLGDRVQPKQVWSEEDERNWNNIWDVLDGRFELSDYGYKEAAKWFLENCSKGLKSLRQQPKQEWSEEDEKMFSELSSSLLINISDQWVKYGKWLKSLKGRITWKPTEAQLASLTIACDRNDRVGFDLTQLLEELKKL